MERCMVLWDLESVPFYYNAIIRKYIVNMGYNYHLDPRYIAVSKKNLHLLRKVKKKRGFEVLVTEDVTKDGADRTLKRMSKQFPDRTAILVSNDFKLAKELSKKKDIIVFYINGSIPTDDLDFKTIHVYDNFSWG